MREQLSLAAERRVNAVCDKFEEVLQAGLPARIEDFLGDTCEVERSALLKELQRLQAEYHGCTTLPQVSRTVTPAFPRLDDYEILGELGGGAMGVVYRAWDPNLRIHVAVKMMRGGEFTNAEERERFRTEAESIARVKHANVVQIYGIREYNGVPFLALELCEGGSLAKKLAGTPLPPRDAARLVAVLANAMQAAHDKGVIHRDLKPANVLLTEDGTSKITDFGLAKILDDAGQTRSGMIMGTPSYMAPEQASGKTKEIGPPCDIYALGAILYECLTGRPPFKAATIEDTLDLVRYVEPVVPFKLNPKVPRDLETICLTCLHKAPKDRFATAEDLAADLENFLEGRPIQSRPPSRFDPLVREWRRRHFVNTANWSALGLWGVAVTAQAHLFVYWGVLTRQPMFEFWLNWVFANVVIWTASWYYLGRQSTALTPTERHWIVVWIGQQIGTVVLWDAAGLPCDETLWAVYPQWAVLFGMASFVEGSLVWGRFYLVALAWFALALVMPLAPEWAPFEVIMLYTLSRLLFVWAVSRAQD